MKKAVYLLIAISFFACRKDLTSAPADTAATEQTAGTLTSLATANLPILTHAASPKQTDPGIVTTTIGGDPTQYAYLPQSAVARKDRLLIFIPGTFGVPSNYDDICSAAAHNGYYAFSVAYSNNKPLESFTGGNYTDTTIQGVMNEYLTGENTSPRVSISRTNSFENRIIKMISYMDSLYPAENWKRFLTADKQIIWSKLSVGGHSQGSDHAMYWSKARTLFRAAFIGGPGSFRLSNGDIPTFMQSPGLTPASRLYGFNHTADAIRPWSDVQLVWAALGVPGTPNSVDDGAVDGSHRLITSRTGIDAHSGTIEDDLTPIDSASGKPLYQPVWQYMLFP